MKNRMRLSPKNKIKLRVRLRLITLASVLIIATATIVWYLIIDGKKKLLAEQTQSITERFGFYRSLEAVDCVANEENDLYNVPIYVMLEHTDFKSKNFGGRLFDASARDLIFVRNGSTSLLKSQIEEYDAARGIVHATVWIDTLRINEKPSFDVYYSSAESNSISTTLPNSDILISMNEGLSGYKGIERITALAAGTFKADGMMGNGRGFSNERGDYLQYNLRVPNTPQNGFTLRTWIYPELKNQSQIIGGYQDAAINELNIGINKQNEIFIKIKNKGEEIILDGIDYKLNINAWSNVELLGDMKSNTVSLFINGDEIISSKLNQPLGYPTVLFWGRSRQNSADGFSGIVDQIELLAETKTITWSKYAYNSSIYPISQWTYSASKTPTSHFIARETTRKALNKKDGKSQSVNEIKFQTQKQRGSSIESTATVSSSATLMQQKLQQIQQKVKKEALAKN